MTAPYRALIVGCGRMGCGRDHEHPYDIYDHASAYNQLTERVELVGFVDRVLLRAEWAAKQHGVAFAGDHVTAALDLLTPDVVSICTPPSDRAEIIAACDAAPSVRGIWCEKPLAVITPPTALTQVNLIRRFDPRHQEIAQRVNVAGLTPNRHLFVICAKDIHTVCHFSDLARWWGVPKAQFHYLDFHGPALYLLREEGETPGRYAGWRDEAFVGGGLSGSGFMERALGNLLDAMEGTAHLLSPVENAIESERWAADILAEP